jgi:ABC-type Mn2+/Zn2+ transport system ATPase subunit
VEINNLIEIIGVSLYTPRKRKLISGVNFFIPKGKITLINGGNGIGKTQLISNILGFNNNYTGEINKSFQSDDFSYLPQVENVSLNIPLMLKEIAIGETDFFSETIHNRPWNRASGGERKRALLTRVLTQGKSFIVLDEPLNHLDKLTQKLVANKLEDCCLNGATILMTGHVDSTIDHNLLNIVELEQWRC